MSELNPHVLFQALRRALQRPSAFPNVLPQLRADIKEYLEIPDIRMTDKVLMETLRRRLDGSPMDIPPDREESGIYISRYGEEFADIFTEYDDLFKV